MFSKSKIQLLCRHVVFGAIIGISLSAIATKHVRLTVVLAGEMCIRDRYMSPVEQRCSML